MIDFLFCFSTSKTLVMYTLNVFFSYTICLFLHLSIRLSVQTYFFALKKKPTLFLKSKLLVKFYLLHHTLKLGIFIKGLFHYSCLLPPASNPCSYLPAHYSDLMTGSLKDKPSAIQKTLTDQGGKGCTGSKTKRKGYITVRSTG